MSGGGTFGAEQHRFAQRKEGKGDLLPFTLLTRERHRLSEFQTSSCLVCVLFWSNICLCKIHINIWHTHCLASTIFMVQKCLDGCRGGVALSWWSPPLMQNSVQAYGGEVYTKVLSRDGRTGDGGITDSQGIQVYLQNERKLKDKELEGRFW